MSQSRLVVAGLSGDAGKTLLSLGLIGALRARGVRVAACKKGPDYIDTAWLGLAAGRPARNLDTWMMSPAGVGFAISKLKDAELVLVEGNRGLYDGLDVHGTHSTAELAKTIGAPVLLLVNATKATRTLAAQVLGCLHMDPDLKIAGVVLNRVGTARQEKLIRQAIEEVARLPVLGSIPRLKHPELLPSRHMGLVTTGDHPKAERVIEAATEAMADALDLDGILRAARAGSVPVSFPEFSFRTGAEHFRVAVAQDEAFCFYYRENLEALEGAGAEIQFFSPLAGDSLPTNCDAVYLGGGFPELHAARLAESPAIRHDLPLAARDGMKIYAECGGMMVLSEKLQTAKGEFPMAGVLDLVVEQTPKPQGHGYVAARLTKANPWYAVGTELRGHEFHYSRIVGGQDADQAVCELERGTGLGEARDGIIKDRVWASYFHVSSSGAPGWVEGMASSSAPPLIRREAVSGA